MPPPPQPASETINATPGSAHACRATRLLNCIDPPPLGLRINDTFRPITRDFALRTRMHILAIAHAEVTGKKRPQCN
jgi:hypothetical protein